MIKHPGFRPRFEWLEDRCLLSISSAPNTTPPQTTYQNLVQSSVAGESIFYNDSSFDGNNSAANAADDNAIATDKSALLPGQTATFANYTSYSRGINGIMVDILDLPNNVTASDFTFMVGNSSNTSTWTQLAVAPTVTIRWGAGTGGSDRIELTWPNNVIQNEWLQVTVLADNDTGLAANTVFYFGNAIGDTGNSTLNAQVNSLDQTATQANQTTQAGITNVYDFNRDGAVNATDVNIVHANGTTASTALNLIATPAAPISTPFSAAQPGLMQAWGDYYYFFAPQIIETNDGTLISLAEARTSAYDAAVKGIAETTSSDGGQTWSPISIITTAPGYPANYAGMGSMVLDQTTGTVFFIYTVNNNQVLLMSTANDGQTWTTPQDISSDVMDPTWGYFATGPSNGIQLTGGADAGRLVVAFDYRYAAGTVNPNNPSYDAVIYSDDNGASWQLGGGPTPNNPVNAGANEAAIVELSNGAIYMNNRLKYAENTAPARGYAESFDGGITWTNEQYNYSLDVSSVQGSLIRLDSNTLLFAAPADPYDSGVRQEMTIWASFNDGQTWTEERVITYQYASYSGMVALGNDSAMLEFAAGQAPDDAQVPSKIELVKFNLAELENGQIPQFTWNFNEEPIGQSAPVGGAAIYDDSSWDERGTVQSSGGVPYYVAGANGDAALRIVNGSNILLSPPNTNGMQLGTGSATFQFVMRTTAANGVLLGTMPGDAGYTFSLVNGKITLAATDGTNSVTLTGSTIDDGNWHDVVAVRNTSTQTWSLYVDGSLVASAHDPTGLLQNDNGVTLGSYADGSDQLTFDIDTMQFTQAALTPSQWLNPATYVAPQPLPAPTTPANGVLTLPGLNFYLPPYNDRSYFADTDDSDPLLIQPTLGTSALGAIDAASGYQVQALTGGTVHYETSPVVGSYWSSQNYTGWTVNDSNGTDSPAQNFDFVQNSETFTLSDVFSIPSIPLSGSLTLVGNNRDTSADAGFDLTVDSGGNLDFNITDGKGTGVSLVDDDLATFNPNNFALPRLSTGSWYQIVVVGNGPGTPLQYYLTPMTSTQVLQYQAAAPAAIGTPTTTASGQNLQIANVIDATTTPATPTVNFNDLAVFSQALSASQVEQMFLDEANPPVVTPSGTTNTFTLGGGALPVDTGVTVTAANPFLTGATLTISPSTLQSGDTLGFSTQNGISGSYNASSGVLTLSGGATPAQYQAALQSVTFSTSSTNTTPRELSVTVNDGPLASSVANEQVNVSQLTPALTASGTINSFTVNGPAVVVDAGIVGSPVNSDLTQVTLTISSGTLQSGDILNYTNLNNGIVGSYSGGVLTLSGTATVAQYAVALQTVTFSTTSTNTITRSISIVGSVGALNSSAAAEQVAVTIAPGVTPSGIIKGFTLGGAATVMDAGVTVSSTDADLTGAVITISPGTLQAGDNLNFTSQNNINGSYSGGVLTLSGSATPAQYQAALRSVTFSTTSTNLTTRSLSVFAVANGVDSNTATEQLTVSQPVTVVGVYVSGTAWTTPFDTYLVSNHLGSATQPTLGYALKTGSAQLTDLPFANINTITVQFSGQVHGVTASSLELVGGTGPQAAAAPTVTSVTPLGSTMYQFNLSGPLGNNKYVIAVASTGSTFGPAVVDNNGAGISGAFVTSSSSFPSGNGLAGSTFDFFFDVLPGDGNQNGTVSSTDTAVTKSLINHRSTSPGYNPYYDFNGAGVISTVDSALGGANNNNRQSTITPPGAPAAVPVGPVNFMALALGVQETGSQSSVVSASAVSSFVATPAATASTSTPTTAGSTTTSAAENSTEAGGIQRQYGRHSFGATNDQVVDAALSDFDPADLWI